MHTRSRGVAAAFAVPLRRFRRLMPGDDRFITHFTEHASLVVEGARVFRALLTDGRDTLLDHYAVLDSIESKADVIADEMIDAIHRTFITPFDRVQVLELITGLDDILDLMKDTGRRVRYYGVAFTPEMLGMADCAVEATVALRSGVPLLGNIGGNIEALNTTQAAVRRAENEADKLLDRGLIALFSTNASPGQKLTLEKVYDLIEAVVDRCEDVADVIRNIVVEQV